MPDESMVHGSKALLKNLPSVDKLLNSPAVETLVAQHGRHFVTREIRELLATLRAAPQVTAMDVEENSVMRKLERRISAATAPRLKRMINLTGTVLHTNMGRALLAEEAVQHVAMAMRSASNLEFDVDSGERGDRDNLIEQILCEITGAEAATVVNNNAAAVLLTIAALGAGKEVIVSRGELVEIGGAFRMPDVMAGAGARMVEVGTTNRTHLRDYENAIGADTALIMKVHTSNYAIQGFTSSVSEAEIAVLSRARNIPFASDLGSGSLVDLAAYGLPREPLPQEMIAAGVDVVTFSGDKLLGGPQAGIIVGKKQFIQRLKKHPLKRALRVSKIVLAALEATLQLYRHPESLREKLPTLRLLSRPQAEIAAVAQRIKPAIEKILNAQFEVTVEAMKSQIGSGSLPVETLASAGVAIRPREEKKAGTALNRLAAALRALPCPVVGRIAEGRLLLDMRCMENEQEFVAQLAELQMESA
ncbi:MAG: L-seryl-tRNA(Sec) selenium transferase [Betaproteobacteria bacterium]